MYAYMYVMILGMRYSFALARPFHDVRRAITLPYLQALPPA